MLHFGEARKILHVQTHGQPLARPHARAARVAEYVRTRPDETPNLPVRLTPSEATTEP